MNDNGFHGIIAYPITPFDRSGGDVDVPMLRQLIEILIDSGVHGIAPLGSTGESAYLSEAEWFQVAEESVDAVARRVPTVVGVADLTTAGAVRRARFAQRCGANAVMVLPTSYWKLSEAEVFAHFGAISESIDIPIMAYNNPATAGVDMSPEFLVGLTRKFENITMIKESSGDITRMQRIAQLSDGQTPFFNGSNPLAVHAFAAGAVGWCTAAPCLVPRQCLDVYAAMQRGDLATARSEFNEILPLTQFLTRRGLPAAIKSGLSSIGLDVGEPRQPLLPLDPAELQELTAYLRVATA